MAVHYSDRYAGLMEMPPVLANGKDWTGRVVGIFDSYTAVGVEAAASTILIGRIPPNARVVDGWIMYDAMGAGVTLDVGDAVDADRLFADVAVSSAGLTRMTLATGMGWLNATNNPVDVVITTAGGALTANAVVTLHLTVQGL